MYIDISGLHIISGLLLIFSNWITILNLKTMIGILLHLIGYSKQIFKKITLF